MTEDDAMLARKTLALLPKQIPIAEFRIDSSGTPAAVAALIATLHFVGWRGRNRNIDPGRPSVADFGRKLYHLNAFGRTVRHQRVTTSSIAIARKARISTEPQSQDPSIELWGKALKRTLNGFRIARFQAIVFDYDGTLCPPHSRREGIDASLAERLENLIGGGLLVGIATGRGKSVREDLQQKLRKQFWPNVWIGYYNGGQIGGLADECVPNKTAAVPESLEEMMSILKDNTRLASLVDELDSTSSQITVLPKPLREVEVWEILEELSVTHGHTAVRSTHSVDILAPGVTKLNLIAKMESLVSDGQGGEILRIGDLGRWPGNDYQLLAHRFGLSVDEVSRDSAMCWNLAPPGHRGVQATLDYLDALNIRRSHARLDVTKLGFTGQI